MAACQHHYECDVAFVSHFFAQRPYPVAPGVAHHAPPLPLLLPLRCRLYGRRRARLHAPQTPGIGVAWVDHTRGASSSRARMSNESALSDDRGESDTKNPASSSLNNTTSSTSSSSTSPARAKKKSTRKVALVGLIFLAITYVWSIILIIPMLIAHPLVLLFDRMSRRFHDHVSMTWMRCSLWTVRVRPHVINPQRIPPSGVPVVYVANHTSYLDIFLFAYLFRRVKYVSKMEIFKIPVIGWAMRMAGNIALMRSSARGQMEAYRKMITTLRNGASLVVFPEGTRSASGVMRRFKPGAFRAAKQNESLVVPVTILGTRDIMPSSALVPLRYPTSPIRLIIHEPIDSRTLSIDQLCDAAFRAVNSALPTHMRSTVEHHYKENTSL